MKKIIKFLLRLVNSYKNKFFLRNKKIKYKTVPHIKGKLFLKNKGELIIGKNVRINSKYAANPIGGQTFMSIVVGEKAILKIGDNSGISNSAIFCMNEINIGENVFIGGDCKIYDTDFHSIYLEDRMSKPEKNKKTASVNIKNGVFIGTGTIILKGITIGKESVIAAGSVVTKNVPDYEIWGGNPVKFIKKLK